ncbi:AP-2 complex subunit beta [Diutina catenulata]
MSDSKYFAKAKSRELLAELDQANKKPRKPNPKTVGVLKKVLANTTMQNPDMAEMMPAIVRILASSGAEGSQLETAKLCCHYLAAYGPQDPTNAVAGALEPLQTMLKSADPGVRMLGLRTMSSVNRASFVAASLQATMASLVDPAVPVRKAACFAVARLYQWVPEKCDALVARLNEMLLEEVDIVTFCSCLAALHTITESSAKLEFALSNRHCQQLVTRLGHANEWGQSTILTAVMGYVPQTADEAVDLIEVVVACLSHENSGVVLNAIKIIVYLSNYAPKEFLLQAVPQLPKRIGNSLVSLLAKPSEIQFLALRNAILLLLGRRYLIAVEVSMFFCNYDDPIYVKDTKLEIIYLLADEANVPVVLRELEEYATEVDVQMARKAVRAFGNLAIKVPGAAGECVSVLSDLVSHGIPYIVQEAAIVLKNIIRRYPGQFSGAVEQLFKFYRLIDEPDAKAAVIWTLGQYGEHIDRAPAIFAEVAASFRDDALEVQYATLTAATKLYLKMPAQGQATVLEVLKYATEEAHNPDLRDRAYMYWRLITLDPSSGPEWQKATKSIVLNPKPEISADNDTIDPSILEELELAIGTLASIYLKPVQTVFRFSKRKHLVSSPALQPRPPKESPSPEKSHTRGSILATSAYGGDFDGESPRAATPPLGSHRNSSRSSRISGSPTRHRSGSNTSGTPSLDSSSPHKDNLMRRFSRRMPSVQGLMKK